MTTTLEKILVPLDGSELSSRILVPVTRLAQATKAEVRAIRVLDGYQADQAMLRGEDPHVIAAGELARALKPLEKAGIRTGYDTYIGDPATQILNDAETNAVSLIAMATHGRSGVDRWIRGSVAERVLRRSAVPVFLVNPKTIGASLPIRRILVPLDGSELSAATLPLALEFARANDSEVVLLYVVEPGLDEGVLPSRSQDALDVLDRFKPRLGGTKVKTVVASGSAALGILEAADKEQVELIAMSTHGRSGISRWAFGSTAEDVLRHATAPLLVLRAPGAGSAATND